MKNNFKKTINIFSHIIISFFIWQISVVSADTIITPQPIFNTEQTATQPQNIPSNKIIQKPKNQKNIQKKKSSQKTTKPSVKKKPRTSKTTKPKTVNKNRDTVSNSINSNSKLSPYKNWGRYLTPPIIIITLILVSMLKKI